MSEIKVTIFRGGSQVEERDGDQVKVYSGKEYQEILKQRAEEKSGSVLGSTEIPKEEAEEPIEEPE